MTAGRDDALARVRARRARHRRRPLVVRAGSVLAGGLLAAVGVLLVPPLPELGLPALLGGLGLLALEFDWAARALAAAIDGAATLRGRWRGTRRVTRAALLATVVTLIAAATLWLGDAL